MVPDYCVYVGRLRIFHGGYWEVINHILAETGCRLIIAVGAAQAPPCKECRFTGKERAIMIEAILKEQGLQSRSKVVTIDETDATYGNWTHLVEGLCPPFLLVYSHSDFVLSLFRRAGYMVKPVPGFSSVEFSFTSTTNRIVNNEPWEYLLPGPVTDFIKTHELDRRVRKLFSIEEISFQ